MTPSSLFRNICHHRNMQQKEGRTSQLPGPPTTRTEVWENIKKQWQQQEPQQNYSKNVLVIATPIVVTFRITTFQMDLFSTIVTETTKSM